MSTTLRRIALLAIVMVMAALPAAAVAGFNGPLFGLATAPDGTILLADASTGIIPIRNDVARPALPLPGVTAIAPVSKSVMWATTGAGGEPTEDTGQALYRISRGQAHHVVNLYEFEAAVNPDGNDPFDSNPYDVLAVDRDTAIVVDAGANALLRVEANGEVEVMAVFPDSPASTANIKNLAGCPDSGADFCFFPDAIPAQSVPTSVALGPDGYLYVGELRGFPGPTGESSIWRVSRNAASAECGASPDCVKVFDGGFTSIIDLAFSPNGKLYVAELDEASWAAVEIFQTVTGGTVNVCDIRTLSCQEVEGGIPILTAITFGNDHTIWATRNSLIPGAAEVFQLP